MAAKKKPVLPEFESFYVPQLDLDKIAEAIVNVEPNSPPLPQYDFDDAKRMIWLAGETWVPTDMQSLIIEEVESKFEYPITGIRDIGGKIFNSGYVSEYQDFVGKKFVMDWKTVRAATITLDWEERLANSWQWKIYSYASQALLFIYRGLNRAGKTRELILEVPETNEQEVLEYVGGVELTKDALLKLKGRWPRHMPFACNAYGQECPFFKDCVEGKKYKGSVNKPLSYSGIERLLLCPEKYRLSALAEGKDETEDTRFGTAVHRGLAEMYSQLSKIFGRNS